MSQYTEADVINRANQLNPDHIAYHLSRSVPLDKAKELVRQPHSGGDDHQSRLYSEGGSSVKTWDH